MRAWISDNDLQKIATCNSEARNIRVSLVRTHLRVHMVEIPALDESVYEKCESGCGPATHYDTDGIPLCDACYADLGDRDD